MFNKTIRNLHLYVDVYGEKGDGRRFAAVSRLNYFENLRRRSNFSQDGKIDTLALLLLLIFAYLCSFLYGWATRE